MYTGIAKDVPRRVHEHNHSVKAARYTRSRRPVAPVYIESLEDKSAALKREAAIKSLSREQKQALLYQSRKTSEQHAKALTLELAVL